jgi:hypothetical protein
MKDSIASLRSTDSRLLKRSCESLLGIASGLIADGDLNDKEIVFLSTWLADHPELSDTWPGEIVCARVRSVLADGVVSSEERDHLKTTLEELVGGSFAGEGAVPAGSTSLPIDRDVFVSLPEKSFCFTGQFLFGTRAQCERTVVENGGLIVAVSKKLDFLVVGELASKDWKYSAHGRKIEAAVEARKSGGKIKIISEAQWLDALPRDLS